MNSAKTILPIFIISVFLFCSQNISAQDGTTISQIDSLIEVTSQMEEDTSKVKAFNALVWKYKTSEPEKSEKIGLKSVALASKLQYPHGASYAAKNLGAVYFYQGDYDNALKFYEISLKKSNEADFRKGTAIAFRNIGNVYYQQSIYQKALEYYFKSLPIREEIGDKKGIGAIYRSIGLIYSRQGNKEMPSAIEYYEKALVISTELNDLLGMIKDYLYLGTIYYVKSQKKTDSSKEDFNKAIDYLEKCKKLSTDNEAWIYVANTDEKIGSIYLDKNELKKAYEALSNSLNIRKETNNIFGQINSNILLGKYYYKISDIENSKMHTLEAYKLAEELHSPDSKIEAVDMLLELEANKGNYKNAYDYSREYILLKDSISNKENTKKQAELALQYEFDKKEKLREAEEAKEEIKREAEKKRQRVVTYVFIGGFIFVLIFALLIFRSYRNKQKANKMLEDMNNEILTKNSRLNQANEEIEAQRDEIEKQRDEAVKNHDKIAEQNRHITDSIVYAQRIQSAVMPPQEYMDKTLNEHFILLKPRDIVSGDYYWSTQKDGKTILAAADCTGHGVPGAFMSLLGISFLNQIVNKIRPSRGEKVEAAFILNELRASVKTSLGQTGKEGEAKDGMDMALVVIDSENMELQYAGAHNPMLIVRDGEVIQYKADKMPVGIFYKEKESFTNNVIQMQKGDIAYLFSDGYVDQFGGPKGRKYMSGRFKKFIIEHHEKPLEEQRVIFDKNLVEWIAEENARGEVFEQTDDVLVIAFKM